MADNKRFLTFQGLPEGRVLTVAIGEKYEHTATELQNIGVEVVPIKKSTNLPEETACHADMLLLHLGKNLFAVDENQSEVISYLNNNGASVLLQKGITSPYPYDIILNKLILGKKIYGYFPHNDSFNLFNNISSLEKTGIKQGYTKCSVCSVFENAIITDDAKISTLLKKSQTDVLYIEKGDIFLSDTHYGFIGGSCFKIDKNTMYFNGNLEEHRNFNEICEFLKKYSVEPIYNRSRRLTDIGGAVQIFEAI